MSHVRSISRSPRRAPRLFAFSASAKSGSSATWSRSTLSRNFSPASSGAAAPTAPHPPASASSNRYAERLSSPEKVLEALARHKRQHEERRRRMELDRDAGFVHIEADFLAVEVRPPR